MTEKNSFVFYHDWAEVLKKLPADEVRNVILALAEYSESGKLPDLSPIADIAFTAFKQTIDRDTEKWENVCKRNAENVKKRWEKNSDTKKTTAYDRTKSYTKNTDSDNEPVSDSEIDIKNNTPPTSSKGAGGAKKQTTNPKPEKVQFAEFVSMTNDEYTSLVAKVGEQGAKRCIEILDNYKGSSGKKYSSDYRAILNWTIARYEEELHKGGKSNGNDGSKDVGTTDAERSKYAIEF